MANFLDDVLEGIGGIVGGTRFGQRLQENDRKKLADEFKLYAATDNPEEKARIFAGIQKNPAFADLSERANKAAESGRPASVLDPLSQAQNKGISQLTPDEQKALVTNPRGARGTPRRDPNIEAAVNLGKLQDARDKFDPDNMDSGTAAFLNDVESGIKDSVGFVDPSKRPSPVKKRVDAKIAEANKLIADTERQLSGAKNISPDFTDGTDALGSGSAKPVSKSDAALAEKHGIDIDDFAQEPTKVSPKKRKANSFEDLGINDADDQQAFQEMQDSLKDKDLRNEAEQDPDGMKRLIEFWKQKKLNKQNIGKAFSSLQGRARGSLGIS